MKVVLHEASNMMVRTSLITTLRLCMYSLTWISLEKHPGKAALHGIVV